MSRLFFLGLLVVLAGIVVGATLWPLGGSGTSADPKPRNSPDAIVVPGGSEPLAQAEFALGMGCEGLDYGKVNERMKAGLAAQGVAVLYGPPLVHLCEENGGNWILHANLRVEPRIGGVLPEDCTGVEARAPGQPCPPSFDSVTGQALSRGMRQFKIQLPAVEVLR
jgi:hypothetical protein